MYIDVCSDNAMYSFVIPVELLDEVGLQQEHPLIALLASRLVLAANYAIGSSPFSGVPPMNSRWLAVV